MKQLARKGFVAACPVITPVFTAVALALFAAASAGMLFAAQEPASTDGEGERTLVIESGASTDGTEPGGPEPGGPEPGGPEPGGAEPAGAGRADDEREEATDGDASAALAREPGVRSGARVFSQACAVCHGREGRGGIAPALAGNRNLERSDYVLALILRGGDGMPAFHGRLSEGEIASVSSHIRTAWGNDFGSISRGQLASQWWRGAGDSAELYQRVCARCHGAEGGGLIGPPLSLNENLSDPQYVTGKILHGQGGMPEFEPLLDAGQIADLASHVRTAFGNDFGPVEPEMVGGLLSLTTGKSRTAAPVSDDVRPTTTNLQEYLRSCALCHGPEGQGGVGPALAGNANLGDSQFLLDRVLRGAGRMPPFARRLSDSQIAAIATHERVGWGNGFEQVTARDVANRRQERTPPEDAAADLNAGRRLYDHHCAACHGSQGRGGVAPALRGNGQLRYDGLVASRIVMGGDGMPPFNQVMSTAEIAAVASYIRTAWDNEFGLVGISQAQNYHAGPSNLGP
ncbi:MAG: c-type cytochrome [Trueperaceae bacterium]